MKLPALLIAAAALGCDTSRRCAGDRDCYGAQGAQCLPGCTPTPVCMTNRQVGADGATAATDNDCLANILATRTRRSLFKQASPGTQWRGRSVTSRSR